MNCLSYPESAAVTAASSGRRFSRFARFAVALVFGLVCLLVPNTLTAADITDTNDASATPAIQPAIPDLPADITNQVSQLDDKYKLAIGDQLSFRILEDEDDPKVIVVTDSGELQVPYIGRYPAVGKTCKQLSEELKLALEKDYYYRATVIIAVDSKPKSRGKIYLAGAVGAPGPQDISGDENLTVSKAILRAGGLNGFANGKEVKVTRSAGSQPGGEKTFTVNVTRILEKGKTGEDVPLQPGDFIFVPDRMIRF